MTRRELPHETDPDHPEQGDVPAGGAGADSGSAAAVGIDPGDTADVQNVSSQNDIAGVGTRRPDGAVASTTEPAALEQEHRAADPEFVRDDEAAGAAAHNARVSARDAGDGARRARADESVQHLPRMAQNAPTRDEELGGIVAQTRADLELGISPERAGEIVRQRLDDAGIAYDDATLEGLARRVRGED